MPLTMFASVAIAALLAASTPSAADTNAVPPRMVTTWNQAQREFKRTNAQLADGAIDAAAAARRRAAVKRAFERVCRAKGIPEDVIRYWSERLKD